MQNNTQIRTERLKGLKPRNIRQDGGRAAFEERQSKSIASGNKIRRKSAVDQYAIRVPYNSI